MRASCLNSIFAKLLARPVHERLTTLVERKAVVLKRDDLTAELLSLWNASGHYADAAAILDTRVFHPWEGGEGKSPASICSISSIGHYSSSSVGRLNRPRIV
nr:Uncharacterised protein [Klebsiella pneumoniae]